MIGTELFRNTPYILQFIFEGQVYNAHHRGTLASGGGADTIDVQLKTNGSKITHLLGIELHTNSERIDLDFIEAPTITDGTTEIVTHNLDRRWTGANDKPADAIIYSDPTSVSGGEVIDSDTAYGVGAPAGFKSASQVTKAFIEQPLLQNTDYVIRLTNFDTVSINYVLRILFYESGN